MGWGAGSRAMSKARNKYQSHLRREESSICAPWAVELNLIKPSPKAWSARSTRPAYCVLSARPVLAFLRLSRPAIAAAMMAFKI